MDILPYHWGAHVSRRGCLESSIKEALDEIPVLRCVQVYIANPRGFGVPKISVDDMFRTKRLLGVEDINLYIHASLLYNLCGSTDSADPEHKKKFKRNVSHLAQELDIGSLSGCNGVVVHIGSCKNTSFGCKCITCAVKEAVTLESPITLRLSHESGVSVRDIIEGRRLLLENCAGEGTKIGCTFDEIVPLMRDSPRERVGICWDTAHSFGAGVYDLSKDEHSEKMINDIKRNGASVDLFHLNDSEVKFGSRVDRHANLGTGLQFTRGISSDFVSTWKDTSLIAECPNSPILDWLWLKNQTKIE